MLDPNDFLQPTKDTLAKRAGNHCSNPWCRSPTAGPHSDDSRAVNVGEAAHIRGARRTSARHDEAMTPEERRVITNGIWLCRTCAALIDRDASRYTVEVLYQWKRDHEAEQLAAIAGGAGLAEERRRLLRVFGQESPAALQLALDKPEYWQYLLSAELTRDRLRPIRRRWSEVTGGLLHVPARALDLQGFLAWMKERTHDLLSLMDVLAKIVTRDLTQSWSIENSQDAPDQILHSAELLSEACEGLVQWEREVAGALFPQGLEDLALSMKGWTSGFFQEIEKIPGEVSRIIQARIPGQYEVKISFTIPESMEAFTREVSSRAAALANAAG